MIDNRHKDLRSSARTSSVLPPGLVEETAWDILLALHSDPGCKNSLDKLGCITSLSPHVLDQWLSRLEDRKLITGRHHGPAREIRAILTMNGQSLLDSYLAARARLEVAARP